MSESAQQAKAIFLAALEEHTPEQWPAFLDRVCASNDSLRVEVERLLRARRQMGSFHEEPRTTPLATAEETISELPGSLIGAYKLLESIGEGGFGVVFMAEQQEPIRRRVALKVLKPGMDTRQVVARFEAERQALALMDHPNIARVFDGGETDAGRPFFVMELVKGIHITAFCDQHCMNVRQRLELFATVCQAVQHAHQKGIIHRDIKPSNVLVTMQDGKPLVKVIDFGIAKALGQQLTDKTVFTGFAQMIGTPLYMSPEQAALSNVDVDTRSDVYSLGVLLYELLTGTTPFDGKRLQRAGFDEMRRIIAEEEPPRPSTRISTLGQAATTSSGQRQSDPRRLSRLVRGELDWIVMKSLEKDRNRRYESASAFAADVQRYLNDEAVVACPPSAGYRLRKFVRRHKTPLVTAGLLGLALLVAVGGIGWAVRDRAARATEAEQQRLERQRRETATVELLLGEEDRSEQEQKWTQALAVLERAEAAALTSGDLDDAIRERLLEVRRHLIFIARLDRIRQNRMAMIVGTERVWSNRIAARDYAEAFRDYGADVEALSPEEAIARLRTRPTLAVPIAIALDDWREARFSLDMIEESKSDWKRLVAVARGLDADPTRDRLRAIWGQPVTPKLQAELHQLVESMRVTDHGPATCYVLSGTLFRAGLPHLATRVLQQGVGAHPADLSLNYNLGVDCNERKNYADAIRYIGIVVSLRPESAIAHNSLGGILMRQGNLDEAVVRLRRAVELDESYAMAQCNLGNALTQQGKSDEGLPHCEKAVAIDPNYAHGYSTLGFVLRKLGKVDQAIAAYRKAIDLNPNDAGAQADLGVLLCDHKHDYQGAIVAFTKAIHLEPEKATLYHDLGEALLGQGDRDGAINAYRKALAMKLDDKDFKRAKTHMQLGALLCDYKHEYDAAIAEFNKAIALEPENVMAYRNLGVALKGKKDWDGAAAAYLKAIQLTEDVAILNDLGNVLYNGGRFDEAIGAYQKAILIKNDNAEFHFNLGNAFIKKGLLDNAIAEQKTAIQLREKFPGAYISLGVALALNGQLDDAIAAYEQAIQFGTDEPRAYLNYGKALHDKRRLGDAIKAFETAVELKKDFSDAYIELGGTLVDDGQFDAAMTAFNNSIRINNEGAAHNGLGNALQGKNRLDDAIVEHKKAIQIDGKAPEFHNCLGIAYAKNKQLDDAIQEFRRAIELKPDLIGGYKNLARALKLKGDPDGAIDVFKKATEVMKNSVDAHTELAFALRGRGRIKEAVEECRTAVLLQPNNAVSQFNLGLTLRANRQPEEAIDAYRAALKIKPDFPEAHSCLGTALCDTGRMDEAADEFRAAILLKEDMPEPHNNLGHVLLNKGHVDQSIKEFQKAIGYNKNYADAHCNLGHALKQKGDFHQALTAMRRGHELGATSPDSAQWVRECERLVELDSQLPDILDGKKTPAGADELIELGQLCNLKGLHRTAERFYEDAFAKEPKLADNLAVRHRYNAACTAVLAAVGQGKEADKFDDKQPPRLRRQALDWLRTDLEARARLIDKEPDKVLFEMNFWPTDPDLASVREPGALAKLPEPERKGWQKLWKDVADTKGRARAKLPAAKKPDAK
jgi:tetratricopeptide (TPR) repeat protein/tRNA A-37 threonylcarbamoyl transferase component Bud32